MLEVDQLGYRRLELAKEVPGAVDIVVKKDLEALGRFGAQHIRGTIAWAEKLNKFVAFDMPTGSSPKPIWEALAQMVAEGKVDLSHVIWFGHEADWPPQAGTALDFERQRMDILQNLGITIQPITSVEDIRGNTIQGNFIPMHLVTPEDPHHLVQVEQAARESAIRYDEIISKLLTREDLISIGHHGVGPDSHGWGEVQLFHLWPDVWPTTGNTFVGSSNTYTPQGGLWLLPDGREFYPGHNFVGRKHPDIFLMGLGRRHMRYDRALEIFNSSAKTLALQKTLEALRGESQGEGEVMLNEFKKMAAELRIDCDDVTTCYQGFQRICFSFGANAPVESFYPLWKLATRYFGSETPVARIIRERAERGLPTTLITTQDVAQGIV